MWPFLARSEPDNQKSPFSSHHPQSGTRGSSQEKGIAAWNSNLSDIFSKAQQKMQTVDSKQPLGSLRTPEARGGKPLTWHLKGHEDITINTLDFDGKKFYENISCKKKKVEIALN